MEEKTFKNTIYKDILLIIIGALLASVPTLLSTKMQGESQLNQMIFDRKLTAMRDYSKAYNNLVSDLLPRLEFLESQIIYLNNKYNKLKIVDNKLLIKTYSRYVEYLRLEQNWKAEVNNQTFIINALFNIHLSLNTISYFPPFQESVNNQSNTESLKNMRKGIIELKKTTVDLVNNNQKIIKSLSLMIQKH